MVSSSTDCTKDYENYIQTIYKPSSNKRLISSALGHYSDDQEPGDISASAQLKAVSNFDSLITDRDSVARSSVTRSRHDAHSKFPVYTPKSSAEYRSVLQRRSLPTRQHSFFDYKIDVGPRSNVADSEASNTASSTTAVPDRSTKMLIDYKTFEHTNKPISQYLYPSYNYVKSNDTRILGSNFMMVSLRQPDAWFSRVDKLLKEANNT